MKRLWDKGAALDSQVLEYTAGDDHALDNRLVRYDVQASIAHAEMLQAQGLLSAQDLTLIRDGLTALGAAHARGEWQVTLALEDGQTALETLLVERIGAAGARVHLGRSRNDQVLTALRLYLRDAVEQLQLDTQRVVAELTALGQREAHVVLPGYTHMQQAMPSTVALWATGFAAELHDDAQGLQAVQRRLGKSPLGSAAGYGTPNLPLDRAHTCKTLGFNEVHEPVTAVQLSRGKAEAQLLFEITLVLQDVARLCADLLLFYTQEFAFIALPDAFTTGSSIMPQKRNPDVFELMRGRSAVAQAALFEVLNIVAKLPSGYQRDLQLIKVPLFRGLDLCTATLHMLVAALPQIKFRAEKINLDPAIHAAAEAYELVKQTGIPFREAYARVAKKYQA